MKTTYLDPLIPPHETGGEKLTRFSTNIGTLTGLMADAERVGHYSLAAMFNRARDAKVAQAEEVIALATTADEEPAEDRRFLLVRGAAWAGVAPVLPRQRFVRPTGQFALTQ